MSENTSIRAIRQAKGLTLDQVAKRLGTTAATVSRWEREPQRVTVPILYNLAGVLQVSPQELLNRVAPPGLRSKGEVVMVKGLHQAEKNNPFDADYIGGVTERDAEELAIMIVEGDAMEPTLRDGDQALVDLTHTEIDRAGMFVFQHGEKAAVRRAIPQVGTAQAIVKADNPAYGAGSLVEVASVTAIGRVVWVGRKV